MITDSTKVLQVLYSGLGGHGSVVTSLIMADKKREWEHDLLFFGVEDLLPAYRLFAEQQQVPYSFVKKHAGSIRDGWGKVKAYLTHSAPDVVILHSPVLVIPAWQYCRKHKKKLIVVEHTPHEVKSSWRRRVLFFPCWWRIKLYAFLKHTGRDCAQSFRFCPFCVKPW